MFRNRHFQVKVVKDQQSETPSMYVESPNTPEAAAIEVIKEAAKYGAGLIVLAAVCKTTTTLANDLVYVYAKNLEK